MKRKIKVAVIGSDKFLYVNKLIHYLSDRPDVDLSLITVVSRNEDTKQGSLNTLSIKVKRPSSLSIFLALPSIKHKLLEISPDIVHVIQAENHSLAAVSVRDKFPTLLTVVGITAREYKFYINYRSIGGIYSYIYANLIGKRRESYVLSKISNIIVESSHNKNIIAEMTNSKIFVIPDGIEFGLIQNIQPDSNRKLDIFCIGDLHPGKGVDLLIKAVPIIVNPIPYFHLAIAGEGRQENELRNLVKKLRLEEYVKFLGFISEEEKFQCYKACKFTVVPSRWDFSPITIYEAMACGKPVIASTQTNSEILKDGETGLLFESENVEDLANNILTLLQDDALRERMGKIALERAKECDWSKIAEKTVEVYRDVIANFHERKVKNGQRG